MSEAKTIPAKYIFLDVVGFTHDRSVEAQSDIIEVLNGIVEASIREHEIPKNNLMFLPASDGICIALLNIEAPYDIHLSVGLDIIKQVYRHSAGITNKMRKFEVRVGINSNTDNLITDINGHRNIAGAGVNLASRIKSMADGNQILVSESVFNALRYHERYISSFTSFRAEIKQNLALPVYQFSMQGFEGLNSSTPKALRNAVTAAAPQDEQTFYPEAPRTAPAKAHRQTVLAPVAGTGSTLDQTQLSLKLPTSEPVKPAASKPEWVKNRTKTETLTFLDQAAPARQNRSLMWAALAVLMVGGAGAVGAWQWLSRTPSANVVQTSANASSVAAASSQPAPSPTASPLKAPQTVAENDSAVKPSINSDALPVPEALTTGSVAVQPRRMLRRPAAEARPPLVQRKVAPSQKPKSSPKTQVAKTNKPKSSKKVTLDDLIN